MYSTVVLTCACCCGWSLKLFHLAKLKPFRWTAYLSPFLLTPATTIIHPFSRRGQTSFEDDVPFSQVAQEPTKNFSTYRLGNFPGGSARWSAGIPIYHRTIGQCNQILKFSTLGILWRFTPHYLFKSQLSVGLWILDSEEACIMLYIPSKV